MHRSLRKLLDDATGVSEFVFALNIDIRGFSDWSLTVDSAQTALFVKKVYAKLIDAYYSDASFYKPTGDGLLVVVPFSEDTLHEVAQKLVRDAIQIVDSFGTICAEDRIINFATPQSVGIGIARGPASRLISKGKTLDYSGRVLNLASRLMDLARPKGVILDEGFGIELLPTVTQESFAESVVYLKGVSPNIPVKIHSWPDSVVVPESYRHPLGEAQWETIHRETTRKELEDGAYAFRVDLTAPPTKSSDPELTLSIEHSSVTPGGRQSKTMNTYFEHPAEIGESAGVVYVTYIQPDIVKKLSKVGATWPVTLTMRYRTQ
jgi:class 3 adenylate cyclase